MLNNKMALIQDYDCLQQERVQIYCMFSWLSSKEGALRKHGTNCQPLAVWYLLIPKATRSLVKSLFVLTMVSTTLPPVAVCSSSQNWCISIACNTNYFSELPSGKMANLYYLVSAFTKKCLYIFNFPLAIPFLMYIVPRFWISINIRVICNQLCKF